MEVTHHPPISVMVVSVALQVVFAAYYILSGCPRRKDPRVWGWCLRVYLTFKVLAMILLWLDRNAGSFACVVVADSAILLIWYIDTDKWKKRWGKIKSAALTAVNQASFRNQQKEAFS